MTLNNHWAKARHRLQIIRKAIEFGLQADAAYSEVDYGAAEIHRAALAQGIDPHAYQFDVAYAKAKGDRELFKEMEEALLGLGYRVRTQKLILCRYLEPPPKLSPDVKRMLDETRARLEAEERETRRRMAEEDSMNVAAHQGGRAG